MIDIELIEGLDIEDAKRVCLWTNEKGEEFILEGEGLLARAILHENDHLNGILYIDLVK